MLTSFETMRPALELYGADAIHADWRTSEAMLIWAALDNCGDDEGQSGPFTDWIELD